MANRNLFASTIGSLLPRTDTVNEEAAPAYALPARHALSQYAATGCLNATFYASAEEQLDRVLALCDGLDPEFIARTAVYAAWRRSAAAGRVAALRWRCSTGGRRGATW